MTNVYERSYNNTDVDEQVIPTVEDGVTVEVSTDAQNMAADITKYGVYYPTLVDGEITVYGKPQIKPYDLLTARPTCSDVTPNVNVNPLTHQAANVRHEKSAHSEYLTHVGVSPIFDPSKVEVVTSEMRDV